MQLAGSFDLKSEQLDFGGHLLLDASLSETVTGFKSVLVRLAQPFFRRPGGGTKLPIRVSGTPDKPAFGLDVKKALTPGTEPSVAGRRRAGCGRALALTRRRRYALMNDDVFKGKWMQLKGQIKEKWGDLTDDDLDTVAGQRDQLVGRIQERYGLAKDEVNRQLDALIATDEEPHRAGAGL